MDRVVVFDIETVPDLAAGRALLGEEADALPDAALRARLGARFAREGQDPATAFLKPPLHALACLALLVAERDAPEAPWKVRRMAARHVGDTPEAEILALFERTLAGRPAPVLAGFNTSGFDLPVLRYRAMARGVLAGYRRRHRRGRCRHHRRIDPPLLNRQDITTETNPCTCCAR